LSFRIAALVAFISGAAALAHQLLWVRRLVDLLGANAGTFSKVIGAFFLGLAAGAWLASKWRPRQAWLGIAAAEAGVAALAGLLLLATPFADRLHHSASTAAWMKWLLPLAVVTPPAILMGLVLPWMEPGLGAGRMVPIYAINTLGGVAGILLTLLLALPAFGLNGTTFLAIGANLGAAALALAISRRAVDEEPAPEPDSARAAFRPLSLAFVSGFLVLGSEVILQSQFSQVTVNSHFSSGGVLCIVLLALAASALLVPLLARLGRRALPVALGLAALGCAIEPAILILQQGELRYLPYELAPSRYAWEMARLVATTALPLLLPAGLLFPLLIHPATAPGRPHLGMLLAVNGLGGWLGAEFTQSVLAPAFGLWLSLPSSSAAACSAGCRSWRLQPSSPGASRSTHVFRTQASDRMSASSRSR
jgi:spermidine synthase